jgi:hypothetical protein
MAPGLQRNVWAIDIKPKPSRKQEIVHANAVAANEARRAAKMSAGRDLVDLVLGLSRTGSGRQYELHHAYSDPV